MVKTTLKTDPEPVTDAVRIIRGEEAKTPLNVAIVGGGKACHNLQLGSAGDADHERTAKGCVVPGGRTCADQDK